MDLSPTMHSFDIKANYDEQREEDYVSKWYEV